MLVRKCGATLWEFNLRDVLRWCQLMQDYQVPNAVLDVASVSPSFRAINTCMTLGKERKPGTEANLDAHLLQADYWRHSHPDHHFRHLTPGSLWTCYTVGD